MCHRLQHKVITMFSEYLKVMLWAVTELHVPRVLNSSHMITLRKKKSEPRALLFRNAHDLVREIVLTLLVKIMKDH